jgi:hypothetical protein
MISSKLTCASPRRRGPVAAKWDRGLQYPKVTITVLVDGGLSPKTSSTD